MPSHNHHFATFTVIFQWSLEKLQIVVSLQPQPPEATLQSTDKKTIPTRNAIDVHEHDSSCA